MGVPQINKKSFTKRKSFGEFFTRAIYDNCLLGKITVMSNGDIVPCFGMHEKIIGNLCSGNIRQCLKKLYENYWSVSVDERQGQKCKSCCLRYSCNSCSKYADDMCSYDVLEGNWR